MPRRTLTIEADQSNQASSTEPREISGAQALIEGFRRHNVTKLFGYPGGAILPVYDALYGAQDLQHILFRHEQGCIHAAQGYARTLRQTAVVIVTSGPGATNIVTGLGDALLDSTPLVCITGQVPSRLLGTDAFQETDVVGCTMSVTKWNTQITRAEDLPDAIEKAFYVANSGRPGPVLIDITKDAQVGKFLYTPREAKKIRSYIAKPQLEQRDIIKAASLLNSAKRPLVLAGHGIQIADAVGEFREMMSRFVAPTVNTLQGLGNLPFDHPACVGMAGIYGHIAANRLLDEVDVILALGMRFDDRVTGKTAEFAPQAKVIHVDIDASELNKNITADVAMLADVKDAIQSLAPRLKPNDFSDWHERFKSFDAQEKKVVRDVVIAPNPTGFPTMEQVVDEASRQADADAIVAADVGQHQMATARYFDYREPNRWLSSGGAGTMGFALPAAIGGAFAAPDRQVICVCGDGGFQMTLQELGTASEHKLNIKLILLDNNRLGMVRQVQDTVLDGHVYGVEMVNPDFCVLAKAYSWHAKQITKAGEVKDGISWLFSQKGPALLHVSVDPKADIYPVVPFGKNLRDIELGPNSVD